MRQKKMNRILSSLLALALCLQMLPVAPAAAEPLLEGQTVPAAVGEPDTVPEVTLDADEMTETETTQETTESTEPETVPETTESIQPEEVPETTEPAQTEEVPETTESIQPEEVPETTEPAQTEEVPETTEPTAPEDAQEILESDLEAMEPQMLMTFSADDTLEAILQAQKTGSSAYIFDPDVSYIIDGVERNSMELLKELIASCATTADKYKWSDDVSTLERLDMEDGKQLILLSNADPVVYRTATFGIGSTTGTSFDLAQEFALPFQGLGDDSHPFQGTFSGSPTFKVGDTLFNNLDYKVATFNNGEINVQQSQTDGGTPIIAKKITSELNKALKVVVRSANNGKLEGALFGEIQGDLNLTVSIQGNTLVNRSDDHAGMIANTVNGSNLKLSIDSIPSTSDGNYAIEVGTKKTGCHAGLLVGNLENASLELSAITFPKSRIQSVGGGAGSIAGNMKDTSITLIGDVNLANTELLGKQTGGVAGIAENVSFTFGSFHFVYSVEGNQAKIGGRGSGIFDDTIYSMETGGIFGSYTCNPNTEDTLYYLAYDGTGFSFPVTLELGAAVSSGTGCAGGLFGKLTLGDVSFSVSGSVQSTVAVVSGNVDVGGLVGQVSGNGSSDTLRVSNTTVTVGTATNSPRYYGCLVGNVATASVRADKVTVTANTTTVSAACGFGGLVGLLGGGCVLNTEDTLIVSTGSNITSGGGLVGYVNKASVVRLSGETNLSGAAYSAGANVGQLVGKQDSALIFATGSGSDDNWKYHRTTKSATARVDDIGNYGQVIRLGDKLTPTLILVNDDNSVTFNGSPRAGYGTIASADDFALHAITFTSGNAFKIYTDFVATKDVQMTAAIDLSGTGIQGMNRDNDSISFSGESKGTGVGIIFNGNGNTLTINTGEPYGLRGNTPVTVNDTGAGQCYRHGYYGLLGKVNSATVQNLTIQTKMYFGADVTTYAGAAMAYVNGGHSGGGAVNTIDSVTVNGEITYDGTAVSNVGGFIGSVGGEQTGVEVKTSTMNAALSYTGNSTAAVLGGAVGKDIYTTKVDLSFQNVTVGGPITNNTTTNAHVGGLVGDISAYSSTYRNSGKASVTLEDVIITSAITTNAIKNSGTTKYSSGGFLGYYWDNVVVTFEGSDAAPAVTVSNASLTTDGSAVGGLCYAATGMWDMQGKAVSFENVSISNGTGDLGLLVCHGERQNENPGSYSQSNNAKALYLVMDTNWGTAYTLTEVAISGNTHDVYDEIVAYTAREKDITLNDAGIISLRTTGTGVVMEENGTRNTYENRVEKFKAVTNPNSRYYYNLDTMAEDATDGVSSPAELVLWSVYKYCAENIRKLLPAQVTSNKITGTLNMKGYSYYPVRIVNADVNIENAQITFHNQEIEALEKTEPVNKSTLSTSGRTQHFTMHSGLFYNYYADDTGSQGTKTLTVRNLTLRGTVGMVEGGSGALICGKLYGGDNTHSVALDLEGLNLYGIDGHVAVADFNGSYAPLLIHQVDSYAQLDITNVTARITGREVTYVPCGTSLIGNVGISDGPLGMNLTFSQMKLADKSGNSCFTQATLLNKLYYQSDANSAVYNFTEEEDWSGPNHTHDVTYGSEIGTSVEYGEGSTNPYEKKYSPSADGTQNEVHHPGGKNFSDYLPYVADKSLSTKKHEIQVNGSMPNVDSGCGTYGDPYRVNANQLQSIAKYISVGAASKGWELKLPQPDENGESVFCPGGETATDITYFFNGSKWQKQGAGETATLTKETVQAYLSNAYYQLTIPAQEGVEPVREMTLNNFSGLGTRGNPFRGVIVGDGITVNLTGTLPSGFINYSYGSVVKDLTLKIQGDANVQFKSIASNSGYVMDAFYGGVIGCILGGDNIVQNVAVDYTGSTIAPTGDKPHLVPVGGYVGMIHGGGVIFRGANTLTGVPSSFVEDDKYFYVNSYVGRVLQGFAVNEGTTELNNSDKNYRICTVSGSGGITVGGNSISLPDAGSLLIFTSVTNSGGAGGGLLRPYLSGARTYWKDGAFGSTAVGGKVRNATYENVGNATVGNKDYQLSLKDDFAAFGSGNTSYLDTKYAEGNLWNVCGDTPYSLTLTGDTYDMSAYGNGYRSISPRYLSTAVCKNNGTVYYKGLNPLISGVSGTVQGGSQTRIQTNITVKEYVDDEYHAIAVGGLFNTIRLKDVTGISNGKTMLQNITIGGSGSNSKATIAHEYWEFGSTKESTHKNWAKNVTGFTNLRYHLGRGLVAVGGFAGNTAMESGENKPYFSAVNTQYLDIKGPFDAGGIIGHTGLYATQRADGSNYLICDLIGNQTTTITPSFHNCTYSNLNIKGGWMVGGYIGLATSEVLAPLAGTKTLAGEIKVTFDNDGLLGSNSYISCQRAKTDDGIEQTQAGETLQRCLPATGGLIGCSSYAVTVANTGRARIENVTILSSRSAGGVVAWPFSTVTIQNVDIIGNPAQPNQVGDLVTYDLSQKGSVNNNTVCEFSGGMVGYMDNNKNLVVKDCSVSNLLIVASLRIGWPCYAGGIVGNINSSGTHQIMNCSVKNLKLANDMCMDSNTKDGYAGGFVARLQNGTLYGVNLLADSIECTQDALAGSRTNRYGNLMGGADSGKNFNLAGVSIQNTKGVTIPAKDVDGTIPASSYVAYADYWGTAQMTDTSAVPDPNNPSQSLNVDKVGSYLQGKDVVSTAAPPYVTTSPRGVEIPIGPAAADGKKPTIYLYGDGANPAIVNRIWDDITAKPDGRFYRTTMPKGFQGNPLDNSYDFGRYCTSTFYQEMGLTAETAKGILDFPVLQVPVGNDKQATTNEIEGYLNLITNNAYYTAYYQLSGHVTRKIDQYVMNENGYFDVTENSMSVLKLSGDSFETVGYDTGRKQFELLTITFTEKGHAYAIQVPIVVRRMLEVDFTATLKGSPSFRELDYAQYGDDGFNSNITVGYGETVSALLQYRYNSAIGENQSYSWDYLLNTDGNLSDPGQAILFNNDLSTLKSLPKGTQLVLIDCADNDKAYRYEVTRQSTTEGSRIPLSSFTDSDENSYSRWLSEIIGAKATSNPNDGKWLQLDNSEGATARVNGQYYRHWKEGDSGPRYDLTVENNYPTQKFYLVIYIPESSVAEIPESEDQGRNLNGYISTSFDSSLQTNVNAVRKNQAGEVSQDLHKDTESTYNFLSSYTQSLEDQSEYKNNIQFGDPEAYILLNNPEADGNYLLKMDFKDTITVDKLQKETDDTLLFFKADISLPSYVKNGESVKLTTANGFPTGCYGTAEFYVYTVGDNETPNTYYRWSGKDWVAASAGEKALSYDWDATGRNMELYLATDNSNDSAVDLAQIRELAKNGTEKFVVEMKMDIHMSVLAAQQVIAGSIQKGDAFTKLNCTTYLSSDRNGFTSTNYVNSGMGEVRYYQSRSGNSTLTHSSNDPTQLGINCSDLASANGVIYTTGVYDLNTLSNAARLLEDADSVTYSLTLWQRQEDGGYKQVTENLDRYLRSLRMNDIQINPVNGIYRWTDRKESKFATADPENGKRFLLPIRVQVNTDVEANGITFANYQLRLTAELYNGNELLDYPVNKVVDTQKISYDYVTYTITRVMTSGYWSNPPSS